MIKDDTTFEPTAAELAELEAAVDEIGAELFGDEYADFILSTIA